MKHIKYLSLIVGVLFLVASCDDNDPQSFRASDAHVSFPQKTASIDENSATALQIPIAYACMPNGKNVTVTLTTSIEGVASPAIEGVDYVIANKSITFEAGSEVKYVIVQPIDNDVFTGKKEFKILISAVSPELPQSSIENMISVTIVDDEHPWAAAIGTYKITGISAFDGSNVTLDAKILASDDDENVLLVYFMAYATPAELKIGEVDGEILVSIAGKQYIGDIPKPTGSWHPTFGATHIEGESLWTISSFDGILENGVISFEYGMGIQAIHPVNGSSGGWFYLLEDGVKFTKQ
ncbi:hypothetical protein D0T50_13250 [Bacteroides sp. 214]|uniref:Calx-beta domain-containing protein n=1 Tax=Bacteroides sp. 214 TaxID=2302935 RepID=UPI0013D6CDDA|nr:Calx-beta domain-containing protein [Bacteroides sp. 214]NDW13848.1 hypothetical protein [Bacteroides sp. 214]